MRNFGRTDLVLISMESNGAQTTRKADQRCAAGAASFVETDRRMLTSPDLAVFQKGMASSFLNHIGKSHRRKSLPKKSQFNTKGVKRFIPMWHAGDAIAQSSGTTYTTRHRTSRRHPSCLDSRREEHPNRDKLLQKALLASPLLNEFLSAFSAATGIPLGFLEVGSEEINLLRALRQHAFGALLINTESERLRCVQRLKTLICEATADSFAEISPSICGFSYLAMPLHSRGSRLGILLAGPMFPRTPRPRDWMRAKRAFHPVRGACNGRSARNIYFGIPVVSAARLEGIIGVLSMFAERISDSAGRLTISNEDAQPLCVRLAKEYIQEKSEGPLTVADVARRASLHPDHLGKVFRNATGMTLTEYIARVRVENVRERLLERSCRVAEVAFAAGFQSLAQFNRDFKKYAGLSPTRYRASLLVDTSTCEPFHRSASVNAQRISPDE